MRGAALIVSLMLIVPYFPRAWAEAPGPSPEDEDFFIQAGYLTVDRGQVFLTRMDRTTRPELLLQGELRDELLVVATRLGSSRLVGVEGRLTVSGIAVNAIHPQRPSAESMVRASRDALARFQKFVMRSKHRQAISPAVSLSWYQQGEICLNVEERKGPGHRMARYRYDDDGYYQRSMHEGEHIEDIDLED